MCSEADIIADKELAPERGGLYIHVAYCRRKCIYCDFFSAGERIADWHRYVDAICSEFKERIVDTAYPIRTVYFGGGTPSLMPDKEFMRLCHFLHPYLTNIEEFTIEVNPDDVGECKLACWSRAGVNRLSIGIQSFNDRLLRTLGRLHDSSASKRAYTIARRYFDNISIDLMFGLPGQTIEMWEADIREAILMRPAHISAYSLMYEAGTALTVMRDSGRLEEAEDETSEKMFLTLIEELKKAGYDHYETSNFALPGYRSKHNSSYWHQTPYLGIGPSAHSYDGVRTRKSNRADLRGYLDYWAPLSVKDSGKELNKILDIEVLTDDELREEYIMTRLRTCEGIDLQDFGRRFGKDKADILLSRCEHWLKDGSMLKKDAHIAISEKSILISDSIILDLA